MLLTLMTRQSQLEEEALKDKDVFEPPTEDMVQLIPFTSQHDNDFYLKVKGTVMKTQM